MAKSTMESSPLNVPDDNPVICITKSANVDGQNQIHLDVEALKSVLTQEDIIDLPVAIYSVAGPTRTGKSFLLTLFMRHIIRSKTPECETPIIDEKKLENWFSWRGGTAPYTRGIYLLKQPFVVDIDVGTHRKAALFLMDTQGIFDTNLAAKEHEIIGALSFLMSSKQFFNLKQSINSIHFDHIYKFAELADEIRKKDKNCSPFQKKSLAFIIRDWEIVEDYSLGSEGGKEYLDSCLSGEDDVAFEHALMKDHFKKTFGEIPCFLLPPPESKIKRMGKVWKPFLIKDIGDTFISNTTELFRQALDPLFLKENNGREITCGQLFEYMDSFASLLNTRENIKGYVDHFILVDAVTTMKQLVDHFVKKFVKTFWKKISRHPYDGEKEEKIFKAKHTKIMNSFDQEGKPDIPRFVKKFRNGLDLLLNRIFEAYQIARRAEEVFDETFQDFKEKVKDFQMLTKFGKEKAKNETINALKHLEKLIDSNISAQCCRYFEEKANIELDKRLQKQKGIVRNVAVVAGVVAVGAMAIACPVLLFAAVPTAAAVSTGTAVLVAGGTSKLVSAAMFLLHRSAGEVSSTWLNVEKQDDTEESPVFHYPFNLSIELHFGEINYPTITVIF